MKTFQLFSQGCTGRYDGSGFCLKECKICLDTTISVILDWEMTVCVFLIIIGNHDQNYLKDKIARKKQLTSLCYPFLETSL